MCNFSAAKKSRGQQQKVIAIKSKPLAAVGGGAPTNQPNLPNQQFQGVDGRSLPLVAPPLKLNISVPKESHYQVSFDFSFLLPPRSFFRRKGAAPGGRGL